MARPISCVSDGQGRNRRATKSSNSPRVASTPYLPSMSVLRQIKRRADASKAAFIGPCLPNPFLCPAFRASLDPRDQARWMPPAAAPRG